ncbi:hypothetical protein DMENIID0001_046500 [Sergentomyia squamirostris]
MNTILCITFSEVVLHYSISFLHMVIRHLPITVFGVIYNFTGIALTVEASVMARSHCYLYTVICGGEHGHVADGREARVLVAKLSSNCFSPRSFIH